MSTKFLDEMNKDFSEFMGSESVQPSPDLKNKVFAQIHADLNPNPWLIFSKLSMIHLISGFVTLSLCPQFGISFLSEGLGLMRFFLLFGAYGCIAFCGAFFIGTSVLVSSLILRPEELRVLRGHQYLQISALALLSLGALIMLDAEVLILFAVTWIVGAVIGGIAMLEFGRYLNYNFR